MMKSVYRFFIDAFEELTTGCSDMILVNSCECPCGSIGDLLNVFFCSIYCWNVQVCLSQTWKVCSTIGMSSFYDVKVTF